MLRLTALMTAVAFACGCGSGGADVPSVDAGSSADVGRVNDVGAVGDLPRPAPCGAGAGRLRVTVAVDPDVARNDPDLWLSLRCGDSDEPLRTFRPVGDGVQTLEGLGPGVYRVFASPAVAPGQYSPRVTLEGAATGVVAVTATGEAAVLGLAASDMPVLAPDAGGTALPGWSSSVMITEPGSRLPIGAMDLSATAIAATSDAGVESADRLAVQVVVRSTCAAPCPTVTLHSVEVRALAERQPAAVETVRFEAGTELRTGERRTLPRSVLIASPRPDPTHVLRVTLFGTLGSTPRN